MKTAVTKTQMSCLLRLQEAVIICMLSFRLALPEGTFSVFILLLLLLLPLEILQLALLSSL